MVICSLVVVIRRMVKSLNHPAPVKTVRALNQDRLLKINPVMIHRTHATLADKFCQRVPDRNLIPIRQPGRNVSARPP